MTTILALQAQGRPGMYYLLMYVGIFAIFYFLVIMPQRRERKKHQEMLGALKPGDQVATAGGLVGEIITLKDEVATLKTGDARVVVERARITRRITPPSAA